MDPNFSNPTLLVDCTNAQQPNPFGTSVNITLNSESSDQGAATSRYVRFTATELGVCTDGQHYCLGISVVTDSGEDVAIQSPSIPLGNTALTQQLTRPLRRMGESIVTDCLENDMTGVSTPISGANMGNGVQTAMIKNIGYLLN